MASRFALSLICVLAASVLSACTSDEQVLEACLCTAATRTNITACEASFCGFVCTEYGSQIACQANVSDWAYNRVWPSGHAKACDTLGSTADESAETALHACLCNTTDGSHAARAACTDKYCGEVCQEYGCQIKCTANVIEFAYQPHSKACA